MSNIILPTATSIELSPMAPSVGRREIGLRSTEVEYDVESANSNSSSGVATTKPPSEPFYHRLSNYLRKKVIPRLSAISLQQRLPEEIEREYRPVHRIEDHPRGYPRLAAFIGCDMRKFLMCRSFKYLRLRTLLYCQDELAHLQKCLLDQDNEDKKTTGGRQLLASRRKWQHRNDEDPRRSLLLKISPKLKEYDDLVERTIRFASLRGPDVRDVQSVKLWISHEEPLVRGDRDNFIKDHDLVALVEKEEEGWCDSVVERALSRFKLGTSFFASPDQGLISDRPGLLLRSKHRIDVLMRVVLTVTAVSMLLGPSAVLYLVAGHNAFKLLLIGAFTILFSAALHTFSKARRHENFAATAAYCAVLVTFLANFSTSR